MKSLKCILAILSFSSTIIACGQEDLAKEYESCCGTEPVEYNVELDGGTSVYLYVPNVFTPNEDGINDVFMPIFNENVVYLNYMVIEQEIFDNTTPPLLYQEENIDASNISKKAWNGITKDGKKHKGSFNYTIFCITKDGKSFLVKGKACSVICGADAKELKEKLGCFYPSQADSKGKLDKSLIVDEIDCFK